MLMNVRAMEEMRKLVAKHPNGLAGFEEYTTDQELSEKSERLRLS